MVQPVKKKKKKSADKEKGADESSKFSQIGEDVTVVIIKREGFLK